MIHSTASDVYYFTGTGFVNVYLFYLLSALVLYSYNDFFQRLISLGAVPWLIKCYPGYRYTSSVHWLSFTKKWHPRCDGSRIKSFKKLQQKGNYLQCKLLTTGLCFLQLLSYIFFTVWLAVTFLPILFIFAIGIILSQTRLITIKDVYNKYMYLLTGDHELCKSDSFACIDEEMLQQMNEEKLFSKTIPLLAVQSINSMLIGETDAASIVGMSWSIYIVFNSLWKWVYYTLYLNIALKNSSERNVDKLSRQDRVEYEEAQRVVKFSYLKKFDIQYDKLCEAWALLRNQNKASYLEMLGFHRPQDLLRVDAQVLYLLARSVADAAGSEDSDVFSKVAFNILLAQMSKQLREYCNLKSQKRLRKIFLYRIYDAVINSEFVNNVMTDEDYLRNVVIDYFTSTMSYFSNRVKPTSAAHLEHDAAFSHRYGVEGGENFLGTVAG